MEYKRVSYRIVLGLLLSNVNETQCYAERESMDCIKFCDVDCTYESGYTVNRCNYCMKMFGPTKESYQAGLKTAKLFKEGESMEKGKGCQESFNIGLDSANDWWKKHTRDCPRCRPIRGRSQGRYQPAKITVLSKQAEKRYYRLYNGDILDLETKTIINRESLLELLDG